ncbi:MAG TPA: hypothetical protein VF625_08750 [Longimicrobium sp.]|jgi:hypothetical protein
MHRILAVLAAMLLFFPAAGAAQQTAPVEMNERVRVLAPDARIRRRQSGTVVSVRPDTITVQIRDFQYEVPLASIRSLDRRVGRASPKRGAVRGGAVGGAFGMAFGLFLENTRGVQPKEREEDCPVFQCSNRERKPIRWERVRGFTAAGAALGAGVGAILPHPRWERVPLATLSATPSATGGVAVGVTIRTR